MDELIDTMVNFGFDVDDLKHLERLSDEIVLKTLAPAERNLRYNVKEDVIKYVNAWANLLEVELFERIRTTVESESIVVAMAK
jgi:hypothetical protein